MRTYYDPEDDSMTPEDRCERLAELGDHMRDLMLDRMMDSYEPSPEEIAADAADNEDMRLEIKADALAILAKCEFMLTGYETLVCEFASGIDNGMKNVDMAIFNNLRTQFSKEISDHYNQ